MLVNQDKIDLLFTETVKQILLPLAGQIFDAAAKNKDANKETHPYFEGKLHAIDDVFEAFGLDVYDLLSK